MKRIVFYSSNSKHRDKGSNCTVYPKWAQQWDAMALKHPDCEIFLVVQLSGRYFLDIQDGELAIKPSKITTVILPMEAGISEFVEAVSALKPDIAVAMPGPVSGYDWNGIRDAAIAESLRKLEIKALCYSADTAMDCFDKWRTHQILKANGFKIPDAVYLHHELFTTKRQESVSTGNVYREYILWEVQNMAMPVVIKSTTGSSSMGVYIAKDYEDAEKYLISDELTEDVLIQEFIAGEEYGAEIHGEKGNYIVSPPFMIFNTAKGVVNDPLGTTTLKFGPILEGKPGIEELRGVLKKLADIMGFSGIMEVDLIFLKGEWYILEINNRWSGLTTLITSSQGRNPYEVYMDEATGTDIADKLNNTKNLGFSCQFKMINVNRDTLKQIASESHMSSVIQYEVCLPGKAPSFFNDAVIGGFDSLKEMLEGFGNLQKKYPEQISAELVKALKEKIEPER